MVALAVELTTPGISVDEGVLAIDGYTTEDKEIVAHFAATDGDLARELTNILAIGVKVAGVISPAIDAAYVERRFEELASAQRSLLGDARAGMATDLKEGLKPVLDGDGPFVTTINEAQRALSDLMTKYFGEESSAFVGAMITAKVDQLIKSGQTQWETKIADSQRQQQRLITEAFDLKDPASSLSKLVSKIDKRDRESVELITELMNKVSAVAERREARERTVLKGIDYEDSVLLVTGKIAERHADAFEDVTATPGIKGKKGDGVATINSLAAAGASFRVVFEVKDHADMRLRDLLAELDAAMVNRDALAAVGIVRSVEVPAAAGSRLQQCGDGRFICVVDPDEEDTLPLEVAYALARMEALRRAGALAPAVDVDEIIALADKAIGQLRQLGTVERQLKAGRSSIDDAHGVVVSLRSDLKATLSEVRLAASGTAA